MTLKKNLNLYSGAVQHGQQNCQRSIGGGDSAKKDTQKTFCKFCLLTECRDTTLYIKPHIFKLLWYIKNFNCMGRLMISQTIWVIHFRQSCTFLR